MEHHTARAIATPLVLTLVFVAALPVRLLSAQPASRSLTLISPDGRLLLDTVDGRGREMIALDELAARFQLGVHEDSRAGTLSVSYHDRVIILTPNQQLVSVNGRLVSLGAAPSRRGGRWLVPLDFINRALAPIYGEKLELRQRARLLLVGNVHVPRIIGRYRSRGRTAQLSLEIMPPTAYVVSREPGRLLIRFEADAVDVSRLARTRGNLLGDIHVVDSLPGLSVELGPSFGGYNVSNLPGPDDSLQVIIDVRASSAETTDATAAASDPLPANPPTSASTDPLPDFTALPTIRTIVVDAGHGGSEAGARGPTGILEKHITLSVAQRLRDAIERRLGIRVILTRNRDNTVDLDERAAIANNNKADIFISLHANASRHESASGAEVFYLSIDEYGEEARALAERESQVLPVLRGGMREIDLILWEMAQVRYLEQSARLAEFVEGELRRQVPMSPRAIQQAPLRVLVGANMPAVLVEMGYISNPYQRQQLADASFQNAVVEALVTSIVRFRDHLERAERTLSGGVKTGASGSRLDQRN